MDASRNVLLLVASSVPVMAPVTSSEALGNQRRFQRETGAAYVMLGFPDEDHDAVVTLSQNDASKVLFRLCFDAATRGDQRALFTVYALLLEGARTEPGAIDSPSSQFPGIEGAENLIRRQLSSEFGADPLAVHADPLGLDDFGPEEVGRLLEEMWPDGGAGSAYGESFARFDLAQERTQSVSVAKAKEEL